MASDTTTATNKLEKGVPLSEVLSFCLNDEASKDVTLEGNDGNQVQATRFVLTARSPVFRKMLLGNFSEASTKDPIKIGTYDSIVLQAIVEYAHTDSLSLCPAVTFEEIKAQLPTLVSIAAAGMFFNIDGVCVKVQETIGRYLQVEPSLSFLFWEACRDFGASVPPELSSFALTHVLTTASCHVTAKAVEGLSESTLDSILGQDKMALDGLGRFMMVQLWSSSQEPAIDGERMAVATELARRHIRLEEIEPTSLSTTVAGSGLFTDQEIMEAYKTIAFMAYEQGIVVNRGRSIVDPAWQYQATVKHDGRDGQIYISMQTISAMPQYENYSLEELKYEDYLLGNKGTRTPN